MNKVRAQEVDSRLQADLRRVQVQKEYADWFGSDRMGLVRDAYLRPGGEPGKSLDVAQSFFERRRT